MASIPRIKLLGLLAPTPRNHGIRLLSKYGRHIYELMRDTRAREPFYKSCVFSKMLHEEQASLCGLIRESGTPFMLTVLPL